jgi:hypothetical protein
MKRRESLTECDSTQTCFTNSPPSHLPQEIVVEIFTWADWQACGPLARTCAYWMRRLTSSQTLSTLVDLCVGTHLRRLPRWLFYALPASLIGDAPEYTWKAYTADWEGDLFPMNLSAERYFYTGGAVCKALYGREWACDTDVWTTEESLAPRDYSPDTNHELDFVVKSDRSKPLQRCLERFDLSIVQQGFLHSASSPPTLYTTPLAVYSYRCKKLLIAIHPLCELHYLEDAILTRESLYVNNLISYWVAAHFTRQHHTKELHGVFPSRENTPFTQTQLRSLSHLTEIYERNTFFENCELCMASLMEKREGYRDSDTTSTDVQKYLLGGGEGQSERMKTIVRWCARVMKYRNRFPDFEAAYVVNPFI